MIRLADLLYSLTAIIIRYHDMQIPAQKIITELDNALITTKAREYSIQLLTNPEFKTQLEIWIHNCTKNYNARLHLMTYLLNEIVFLNSVLNKTNPCDASTIESHKMRLISLLRNCKNLLLTTKNCSCKIQCFSSEAPGTPIEITLNGLIDETYFGKQLCNSGLLIHELLQRVSLSDKSTEEEIGILVEYLFSEHQNILLIAQLRQEIQAKDTIIAQLTAQVNAHQDTPVIVEETPFIATSETIREIDEDTVEDCSSKTQKEHKTIPLSIGFSYALFFNPMLAGLAEKQLTATKKMELSSADLTL
ncbi:MAG: hypothetical protein CK426_02805 [Legionella sp.]|nr:MAG: hypothetical protein CK423_07640 [Legionella sp.]PJD99381.1 MAG: hypothetical protein CK426_02805 [Legionella sp.]